jgi:PAS domain-containing protein
MSVSHEDDDAEVAEQEAIAALGEGWEFELPDPERFRLPGAVVDTYGVAAHRDGRDAALVVAVGKANAFRQLIRRVRGDLQPAEAWAPPLPLLGEPEPDHCRGPYDEKDAEVEAALRDAVAALPDGWQMYDVDRERFRVAGRKLEVFGVSAVGAGGDGALVLAVGEANAYRQLARRLRGELEPTDVWAPPLEFGS